MGNLSKIMEDTMWKLRAFLSALVVGLLVLPVLPVAAQEGGEIGLIFCVNAVSGKTVEFEAAAKAHNTGFHQKQGDDWTWNAWQVLSGPNVGRYCWGSFDHEWAEFDNRKVSGREDGADWRKRTTGLTQDGSVVYTRRLSKISRPKEGGAPMFAVRFFEVRYGGGDEFEEVVGKFHEAIVKTEMPWNYNWFVNVSGDRFGTYVLVLPRENFAAMQPTGKTFVEMLEEAYGKKEATVLLERLNKLVEKGWEHMTAARPDLSYIPE